MSEFLCKLIDWILTCVVSFVGGYDGFMKAIFIFMLIEYITSVMCVIAGKTPLCKIGIKEFVKKVFMLMLIGIANTIDVYIANTGMALRTVVIMFYVWCLAKSILENGKLLGVTIPSKFKKGIRYLWDDADDNEDNKTSS